MNIIIIRVWERGAGNTEHIESKVHTQMKKSEIQNKNKKEAQWDPGQLHSTTCIVSLHLYI